MAPRRPQKSTIVRTLTAARLLGTRAAFRTLESTAPALGARWAARLWLTPPPRRTSRHPDLPPGDRFTLSAGAAAIAAETWGTGPVAYLVHGWGGWRGQLGALVPPLVAAGHRVVALDAPGHGESGPGRLGGRRATLPEFAAALTAATAVTGPAHAIIAHSAGCVAAAVAVRDGLPVGRLVFLAPGTNPMHYLPQVTRLLGLGARTGARLVPRLEQLVGRDMADFDLVARASEATAGELPPLLILHDRGDRETAHAGAEALADAWPDAKLISTEGLGHRRILSDPEVVAATAGFVTAAVPLAFGSTAVSQ